MQYNVRSFDYISSLSTSRLHRCVHSQYKCAWVTQYQQKILFGNSPPEYIMGKIVFLKGNWAAMDDLLLQFMILNHITRPVKQFTSQLTAQHAQQPGSSSAWPRGDCVQIVRQVVHAGVRSVNRCPLRDLQSSAPSALNESFSVCPSFHYCRKRATCIPAPPLNTTPILRQMVGDMWSAKRRLSEIKQFWLQREVARCSASSWMAQDWAWSSLVPL